MNKSITTSPRHRNTNNLLVPRPSHWSDIPLNEDRYRPRPGRFFCAPSDLPADLSGSALKLYIFLCSRTNNRTQRCFWHQASIALELGISIRSVERGISTLRRRRLFDVKKRLQGNVYTRLKIAAQDGGSNPPILAGPSIRTRRKELGVAKNATPPPQRRPHQAKVRRPRFQRHLTPVQLAAEYVMSVLGISKVMWRTRENIVQAIHFWLKRNPGHSPERAAISLVALWHDYRTARHLHFRWRIPGYFFEEIQLQNRDHWPWDEEAIRMENAAKCGTVAQPPVIDFVALKDKIDALLATTTLPV